jgi:hypothetical protein
MRAAVRFKVHCWFSAASSCAGILLSIALLARAGEVKLCTGLVPDTWWMEHVDRAQDGKCPGFDSRMCQAAGERVRRCLADSSLNCCAIKNHYDAY